MSLYVVDSHVRDVQLSPMLQLSDRFRNLADWYVESAEVLVTETGQLDNPEK